MKERKVKISSDAEADLICIYQYVSERSGHNRAFGYIQRIRKHLESYKFASKRGSARDDIRPGLRIAGFEKRVTIAFVFKDTEVIILRIFYGGRNRTDDI